MTSPVLLDVTDGVATLTLNRPAALNALSVDMMKALADATARLIEMGYRMAMLPGSNEAEEWRSVAAASGAAPDIVENEQLDAATVVQRLVSARALLFSAARSSPDLLLLVPVHDVALRPQKFGQAVTQQGVIFEQ